MELKNHHVLGLMAATIYAGWVARNEGIDVPSVEKEAVEKAARMLQTAMNRETKNPLIPSMQ